MINSNRSLIIAQSPAQAERILSKHKPESFLILATNVRTLEACRRLGHCKLLDEAVLKDRYRRINRWVYEELIRLTGRYRQNREARLFLESHFYDFKNYFLQVIKYILTFEKYLQEDSARVVDIYDNGRSLLALTLKKYAESLKPPLLIRTEVEDGVVPVPLGRLSVKKMVYRAAGWLCNEYAKSFINFTKHSGKKRVLVSGSLRHLGDVVEFLAKSCEVMFLESEFNLEKYFFCRQNHLPFLVVPTTRNFQNPFAPSSPFAGKEGALHFEGRDLTVLYHSFFENVHRIGYLLPGFNPTGAIDTIRKFRIDGVLLDEDYALRRVLAVAANECDIPSYVVSHGVPSPLLLAKGESERPQAGYYYSSEIFVHSDFEKWTYDRIYYDPAKIHNTGLPRYDRIRRELDVKKEENNKPAGRKTILFCGIGLAPYDFAASSSITSLLGQRSISREFIERYLRDVVEACSDLADVTLQVKPHYADEAEWRKILAGCPLKGGIRLLSHRDDIFRLEAKADLIISPISTVLVEAILYERPVVALDYAQDEALEPYRSSGLVEVVRGKDELKPAIHRCLYDPQYPAALRKALESSHAYFTGVWDGQATRRVAEYILKGIHALKT